MKKALLLVCILSVSVVTTACINNLAVQELNNKAAVYMEKGNYTEAIERLKSSIDLDESVYATHYNLGIAYTKNNEYQNAINSYKKVIELNPEFADAYYSIAVAEEDILTEVYSNKLELDDAGQLVPVEEKDDDEAQIVKGKSFDEKTKTYLNEITADAVKNYELYLQKGKDINDKAEVEARIRDLKSNLTSTETAAE